jgi:prephenate dehydratase
VTTVKRGHDEVSRSNLKSVIAIVHKTLATNYEIDLLGSRVHVLANSGTRFESIMFKGVPVCAHHQTGDEPLPPKQSSAAMHAEDLAWRASV